MLWKSLPYFNLIVRITYIISVVVAAGWIQGTGWFEKRVFYMHSKIDILRAQICAMWYVKMVKLHQTQFYWSVKRIITSSKTIKCAIAIWGHCMFSAASHCTSNG